MDKLDSAILDLLQKNADLTIQDISNGFIQKTVAILDPKKAHLNTTAFVFVTMENHDQKN
ncbi:Lrp/AsnC family transcriptional regulator [Isorropodon fossajaponicum symbiont]|uniref:Lrp/AsnC family transcriptional regulator n=1 Tax=Isorropodon fossajaponicum symbiont TaxID=883811 RepID=UPI001CED53F0|nr:winged helix-turn-helix transcriptional regulator [Isorropodon fossajaponicum symbiont]